MAADSPIQTLVIGAGAAGLTCARQLHDAGHEVVVLDKSRGVGGRMATRRREGAQFDHGAPLAEPSTSRAAAWLASAAASGHATLWTGQGDPAPFVGLPGMSGMAKSLISGLDIRTSHEVTALHHDGTLWHVVTAETELACQTLVIAIPAPQAARLFGEAPDVLAELNRAEMAPCWTLMVQFETPLDAAPFQATPPPPFHKIVRDSAKPGRTHPECWVAHATADWTRAHLELEFDAARDLLLAALADATGPLPAVKLSMAHRWRFGLTERPLGQPCLSFPAQSLWFGGDWALGSTVAHAIDSGDALARAVRDASHERSASKGAGR